MRERFVCFLFILSLCLVSGPVRAQEPVAHPRLLMRAGEEPKGVTEGLFKAADSVIVSFSRCS